MLYEDKNWLSETNKQLEQATAHQRVEFAFDHLPPSFALSSSFGIQSAVSLHLLTQVMPDIPVIVIDTGYLFKETYQFIDMLSDKLALNLKVYSSSISSAWQEARYGKLWEEGIDGLNNYNSRNKVEPMERALSELDVGTWFAGLRRQQSKSRQQLPVVQPFKGRMKVHPLIDWTNQHIHQYLKKNNLPYHPLWEQGYVSIGDIHSTVPLSAGLDEEDTRFGGINRECGLHVDSLSGL